MEIRALIAQAQTSLSQALALEQTEARFEAQLMLQSVLNVNRAWLLSHENDALQANIHAAFEASLKRRLDGEPIAYILGRREFYGLDLIVTPDTLIPRPDTETLVEAALAKIPHPSFQRKLESRSDEKIDSSFRWNDDKVISRNFRILDLGTGTGAIALAIASQRPEAEVIAVDASPAALAVAQSNAQNLNIKNVQFALSDWFSALQGQTFDVIVSNPPYIANDDPHLRQGDLRFEPTSALVAVEDGLSCIRQIIREAKQHLTPQGWLMLEHGHDQAASVRLLLEEAAFSQVSSALDLSSIERVSLGTMAA